MKNLLTVFFTIIIIVNADAQNAGIGTTAPDSSAMLEIQSANKGFLMPRLADTSLVNKPAEGLFIYNKNAKTPFFHDGLKWQRLSGELSTSANSDSLTYILTGLGTATELPATSAAQSGSAPMWQSSVVSFSKKLDVNTVPIHQAIFTETSFTSIEFKYYKPGATTPTVSIKLKNVTLLSNSLGIASGAGGGLSDESYTIKYDVYGYKDWINNQSFGYNLATHALTTY